jgi:oligopeptide transport system substrate-binding protein
VDTYLGDIVGVREKLRGQARDLAGVKVIDERTIALTIDEPKSYFLAKLTYPTAFVLDRQNVESRPDWFLRPNGTGPFKLAEYSPGNQVLLEANPDYYLGAPKLKRVRFFLGGGTPMVMYENNEIYITGVGLEDLKRIRVPDSPLKDELSLAPPGFSITYLGMNTTLPPFDDPKVRQALAAAIPKEIIGVNVLENLVRPAYGMLPPGFPGYNAGLGGVRYDPERAKQLVSESKYGPDPGKWPRITLTSPGSLGSVVGFDLQAIIAVWRDTLGVDVELRLMEFATFLGELDARALQMWESGWVADYPDPQNFLDLLFHSDSLNNNFSYVNPELDDLLNQARGEPDEEKRFALYRQAEEIIATELPVIPLWFQGDGWVLIKPFIKDYILMPLVAQKYRFVSIQP